VSPTFQVVPAAGLVVVAVGARLAALMVTAARPVGPWLSVTCRLTVYVPTVVYV